MVAAGFSLPQGGDMAYHPRDTRKPATTADSIDTTAPCRYRRDMKTVNGVPILGFGTWPLKGDACVAAVSDALKVGYRHIDTADSYENHRSVGRAIRESGIDRGELFLTTKVRRDDLRRDTVIAVGKRFA